MKTAVSRWIVFSTLVGAGLLAHAQGTAFTYNGRLTGNGAPVSGAHDMRFTLYDAVNGNAVAGPLTVSPVDVANGLFTVRIDFGAGAFPGAPRWLDVAVRPVGGGSFTALTPRHEVTSSPYSIRSQSAATADGGGGGGDSVWSLNGSSAYYSGSVGIGTATPASRLTVRTPPSAFFSYGIEHTDGNVRLSTYLDAGYGGWLGTRSNHPLNFFVNDGLPSLTIDTGGATTLSPAGGYGTTTFGTPNAESGFSIKGANRADVRFNGASIKMVAGSGVGPPSSLSGIAVTTAGNVGIGTDAPLAKLDVRGNTRTCTVTITGGCDLAEPFPMKEPEIEKGAVVVIDDEHPGRLKLSTQAYDQRVAGIVSGANGINTGIALQQAGVLDQGQPVALNGRVYVQADTASGAIKPGDLLTTSDTPGHAMKVGDHQRAQGAILGKAMSGLSEGQGFVLVLVTLQ